MAKSAATSETIEPSETREQRAERLAEQFLPSEMLERFRERAAGYDRDNAFCHEDIEELRGTGYLTALVPTFLGGGGLSLTDVTRLQQRLAAAAPGTALAINMHLMCTGVVLVMHNRGDHSLKFVFEEAVAGEIFAFGISEPANDWVLQGSRSVAEPQPDGGYLITGTKIFTSLSPVWTRLITHGLDTTTPGTGDAGQLIYGFVSRPGGEADTQDGTIESSKNWDVMGMRASHSRTTKLTGARIAPDRVVRKLAPGRTPDLLVFAITSCFQLLVASVYAGVARRALELGALGLAARHSAKAGASLAENPESRARLSDAYRAFLAVPAQIELCARDLDEGNEHGARWPELLVAARLAASDAARSSAETGMICTGGAGFGGHHEMSRIYRDATASLFHPPSADAARPMFAAALLDS